MAVLPPAREAGLGADHARRLRPIATTVGHRRRARDRGRRRGMVGGPLIAAALVGTAAVALLAMRKIGGLTGDVLGAIEQVVECLVLVTVSGLARRHDAVVGVAGCFTRCTCNAYFAADGRLAGDHRPLLRVDQGPVTPRRLAMLYAGRCRDHPLRRRGLRPTPRSRSYYREYLAGPTPVSRCARSTRSATTGDVLMWDALRRQRCRRPPDDRRRDPRRRRPDPSPTSPASVATGAAEPSPSCDAGRDRTPTSSWPPTTSTTDFEALTAEHGFRVDAIFPADAPTTAIVSGHGLRLRLESSPAARPLTLHLLTDDQTGVASRSRAARRSSSARSRPTTSCPKPPSLVFSHDSGESGVGRAGMRYRDLMPDRWGGASSPRTSRSPTAARCPTTSTSTRSASR